MDHTEQLTHEHKELSQKFLFARLETYNFYNRDPSPVMKTRDRHQPCRGEIRKAQESISHIHNCKSEDFMNPAFTQIKLYRG
ncbi:unnamed protein product [Blepharisma stoltei]|uniref:Uncharacterized protein n=1 Tax=Blepharisma stoltei TaxID=1481888 RepID=A0AAU9JLV1_9CILI|nr:unnamed protein product [Blepharisma stoltei]